MNAKQEAQVISRAIAQGLSPRGVQKRLATTRAKASKNAAKRRFEQVERNSLFDAAIEECRKKLAKRNYTTVDVISKSAAIRYATILVSSMSPELLELAEKERHEAFCERCNNSGIISIRNGDDDIPCPDCAERD